MLYFYHTNQKKQTSSQYIVYMHCSYTFQIIPRERHRSSYRNLFYQKKSSLSMKMDPTLQSKEDIAKEKKKKYQNLLYIKHYSR